MREITSIRLRAGILPLVLAISLVMASLCSVVLLLAYYHAMFSTTLNIKSRLQRNLSSAIELSLAAPDQLPLQEWSWFDLYSEGIDSVGVHRSIWGVYELAVVKAKQGPQMLSKAVLLGTSPAADAPALYLADYRRPISIAGEALIRGNAYLPEAGIKAGYVNRNGYGKAQLVFGKTLRSENSLPPYEQDYRAALETLFSPAAAQGIDSLSELNLISFGQAEAGIFHSSAPVSLGASHALSGKILIKSDKQITVGREARLEGVILVAPKISLERGFRGSLQAFATDTLLVGEDVELGYPSAVGVLQDKQSALLELMPGARIEGMVFLLNKQQAEGNGLLVLHGTSKVMGQVYVAGYAQHEGVIEGSLYAQKLFLKTPSSIYENYLYNGQIDRERLPKAFVASSGLAGTKGKRKIIAWVE